jgi:preprotein translocase subunit SecY
VIFFQDAYKSIDILSAKQLNNYSQQDSQSTKLKNSYIPIKLNQGGIMPLVFSTTIATFLFYPLQLFITGLFSISGNALTSLLTFSSFTLNIILVVFFQQFLCTFSVKTKRFI